MSMTAKSDPRLSSNARAALAELLNGGIACRRVRTQTCTAEERQADPKTRYTVRKTMGDMIAINGTLFSEQTMQELARHKFAAKDRKGDWNLTADGRNYGQRPGAPRGTKTILYLCPTRPGMAGHQGFSAAA